MKIFRSKDPQRTYSGPPKNNYKAYREELASDFNNRCGYTDCSRIWWADGFHIDHFAPKKPKINDEAARQKFTDLEHEYSNLVYACPQVNRAKGNDWPSDDPTVSIVGECGYLDPCDNLNDYFERTDSGGIIPKGDSPIAKYMWCKLKLFLIRYEIYWRVEQLVERKNKLHSFDLPKLPKKLQTEIKNAIYDLDKEHSSYLEYLDVNYAQIDQ